jgi:CheY-like chemotaxis protein
MSRVLVVEDEAHLAQGLRFNLEAEGYSAEVVGDGETATERLLKRKENFDVVVLDIMLPGKDGFSVVSELRAASNYVPVLMLTARGQPMTICPSPLIWRSCWRACRDCCGAATGCVLVMRPNAEPGKVLIRLATLGHSLSRARPLILANSSCGPAPTPST